MLDEVIGRRLRAVERFAWQPDDGLSSSPEVGSVHMWFDGGRGVHLDGASGLTATTIGSYPHTKLTIQGVEQQDSDLLDEIWTEHDPWAYALEQEAQSFAPFYAIETDEP